MAHARKQLRDAVVTLLSAAPVKWRHVFNTRFAPTRDVTPYLLVFIESEISTAQDLHSGFLQQRDMNLSIHGHLRVVEGEDLEDAMDAMAVEIEKTLTQTDLKAALGNKLKILELIASSSEIVIDDNERTYAEIALGWRVQLFTTEGDPETLV